MMFDIISTARSYIGADKVRALAVTSPARNPSLPQVPTMTESGIPDYEVGGWYAVYGSAPIAEGARRALRAGLRQRAEGPRAQGQAGGGRLRAVDRRPGLVEARAKKERAMWATVTKDIKVE